MIIKQIQLGLIHVAVAMTLVPINSTLNRVMIKELAISATLVAFLASLPYLFSPIQVAIGSFSDRHPVFGYRRTPYILLGLGLCVAGLLVSPQAAFTLGGDFQSGLGMGLLAFGAWGMGFNLATVSYLSLATEISGEKGRGRTIAIMWFMMITSIILTAVLLSRLVGDPYSPELLVRAFQWVGVLALGLGLLGLIGLERRAAGGAAPAGSAAPAGNVTRETATNRDHSWKEIAEAILGNRQAALFFVYLMIMLAAILGQDILLEPFGGEAFGLSVQQTTRITSLWGTCVLAALLVAGALETRVAKRRIAQTGAVLGIAGFGLISLSGFLLNQVIFFSGVVLLGLGTGLSTVSNLALMFDMTTAANVGLFMGAWGMSNAFSRLIGTLLAGGVRDVVTGLFASPVMGYVVVFLIEGAMLAVSLWMLRWIDVKAFHSQAEQPSLVERAAIANDI